MSNTPFSASICILSGAVGYPVVRFVLAQIVVLEARQACFLATAIVLWRCAHCWYLFATCRHSCSSLRAQRVIIALFVVLLAQFIRQRRGFSCVPRTSPQMPQKCPGDAPQGPASAPEMPQTCPANAPEMPRAIPACHADAPEMPRKSPARVGLLPQKRPFLCPTFRNAWREPQAATARRQAVGESTRSRVR